jgi:outer membrane protein OmpA-like peptidoglycan-associated protein
MALSERRAKAVAKYILGKGITADRIVIEFFGETKPVDTSNTRAGNSKNRRVEFRIIKML